MIQSIIYTTILIGLSVLLYKSLLEKLTFFQANRIFLVASLVLAVGLPYATIPVQVPLPDYLIFNLTESVSWDEPQTDLNENYAASMDTDQGLTPFSSSPISREVKDISIAPLETSQDFEYSYTEEGGGQVWEEDKNADASMWNDMDAQSMMTYLAYFYFLGLFVMSLRLLGQLMSIISQIFRYNLQSEAGYYIIDHPDISSPFSFLNIIFIDSGKYDCKTYSQILAHERIHVSQWHTLDTLLVEIVLIFQWFNPFAWWYSKLIKQNLEYIVDRKLVNKGHDAVTYQLNLLKVVAPSFTTPLVMNYNHSLLKKRILMMNKPSSNYQSGWKYGSVLLIFFLSALYLNAVINPYHHIHSTEPLATNSAIYLTDPEAVEFSAISVPDRQASLSVDPDINQSVSEDILEEPIEVTDNEMDITESSFQIPSSHVTLSTAPINIAFSDSMIVGSWSGTIKSKEELCLNLAYVLDSDKRSGDFQHINNGRCYSLEKFDPSNVDQVDKFELVREEGKIVFNVRHKVEENNVISSIVGDFVFEVSEPYRSTLQQRGVRRVSDQYLFSLFLMNTQSESKEKFIQNILDYQTLALSDDWIEFFVVRRVPSSLTKGYIEHELDPITYKDFIIKRVPSKLMLAYSKAGYDPVEYEEYVTKRVPPELLKEYESAGFDVEEYGKFIDRRVSAKLLQQYREAGLDLEEYEDYINKRVSPSLLKKYQTSGLSLEENEEFVNRRVSPDLIKAYEEAGLSITEYEEYIERRVPAKLLIRYRDAGFSIKEYNDFINHRVSPELLAAYQKADLSLEEYEEYIVHRVSPSLLVGYQQAGFSINEYDDFINHRVSPELLAAYQKADLSLKDYEEYIVHRVPPTLLIAYQQAGFSIDEYDEFINHRVEPELLTAYQQAGLPIKEYKEYINKRVPAGLLIQYRDAGFSIEESEDYINKRIPPALLRQYKEAGLSLTEHDDFINKRVEPGILLRYQKAGLDLKEHEDFILKRMEPEMILEYRKKVDKGERDR